MLFKMAPDRIFFQYGPSIRIFIKIGCLDLKQLELVNSKDNILPVI